MRIIASLLILFFLLPVTMKADHITGGEMYYSYAGFANGLHRYNFTMKLYMRCNSGRSFNNPTIISVFGRGSRVRQFDLEVPLASQTRISIADPDPCISNPPEVCYEIGYYNFQLNLPASPDGYIVAGQVNYRISGIANLSPGYSQIGATYSAEIPGTAFAAQDPANNGARFIGSDLVIVCANSPFKYSFAAADDDNDNLSYTFCEAYRSSVGPGGGGGASAAAPLPPPYESVPYYGGQFNGGSPLGSAVTIDPQTGLVSGIAPAAGVYVVTVCVNETRNGKVIAVQRKDLQIAIASCNLTSAILKPEYLLCRDTKTLTVSNLSLSSLVNSYDWEFSDASGALLYTTKTPFATYTFPDTGIYQVKLTINKNDRCTDSTTAIVRVFPGFTPDFAYAGVCANKPTLFTDLTSSQYGKVNGWNWSLGDNSPNFSTSKNATYSFATAGDNAVKLLVSDTKGCRDSVYKQVNIVDRPPVLLAFNDTIICVNDQLQLKAAGAGNYTWTPNSNIINANTATPTVSPKITTVYTAHLNDNGCLNSDSVMVRVTDHVNLLAMPDTTICQGDSFQLHIVSDGLKFSWTPANQVNDPALPNPIATSSNKTSFEITANIGGCVAKDQVIVTTVPYPFAYAGADTAICFGTTAMLRGQSQSDVFRWSPPASLNDPTSLTPLANPATTTTYVLSVFDAEGCPKAGTDTVIVVVLPKIKTALTNDTSVVIGQPVQLFAGGGDKYAWSPSIGLSSTNVSNPQALYTQPHELIVYKVLIYEGSCFDSAFLRMKVFSTLPTVFVPTGFTPNADGTNDLLKPIAVGIAQIEKFSIYNRYGQLIFSTSINGHGWDGKVNGQLQQAGAYVWYVRAIDYNGKPYHAKGTSVLIR